MTGAAPRVRFAPSPTGALHIGGARSALFNWLFARSLGGVFILRIEDTDAERSTVENERNIMETLERLGLNWDEGPDAGGDHGPYRQSQRAGLYQEAADKLASLGLAYPCFCSAEELERDRKAMMAKRVAPRYSGKCRELDEKQREEFKARGIRPALRFMVPRSLDIDIEDMVRGRVSFKSRELGDFIIVRSGGDASFMLASAVDDMLMEITHVIRGEDHLSNTPRQTMIINALGGTPPEYAHLPLVLDTEGKKLSKREGATDILGLLGAGHTPEAVNSALAMLGWSGIDGSRPVPLEEMAQRFSISQVSRSPAHYDQARLEGLNLKSLKEAPLERFMKMVRPFLDRAGLAETMEAQKDMDQIAKAVQEGMSALKDAADQIGQFIAPQPPDDEEAKALGTPESASILLALAEELSGKENLDHESFQAMIKSVSRKTGIKGKQLYMIIRLAATGRNSGPKLFDLFRILGPEEAARRLDKAREESRP